MKRLARSALLLTLDEKGALYLRKRRSGGRVRRNRKGGLFPSIFISKGQGVKKIVFGKKASGGAVI